MEAFATDDCPSFAGQVNLKRSHLRAHGSEAQLDEAAVKTEVADPHRDVGGAQDVALERARNLARSCSCLVWIVGHRVRRVVCAPHSLPSSGKGSPQSSLIGKGASSGSIPKRCRLRYSPLRDRPSMAAVSSTRPSHFFIAYWTIVCSRWRTAAAMG